MTAPLRGRTAIVTGGTGYGIVERLLADGANVVIGALTEAELKKATEARGWPRTGRPGRQPR